MRGNARAFGGCGELHPDDLFRHVFATGERAETAIRPGDHPLAVTDHRHSLLEPPSDKFRMFDKIRGGSRERRASAACAPAAGSYAVRRIRADAWGWRTRSRLPRERRVSRRDFIYGEKRISVRFSYECHDDSGNWFRSYGNENWEFDENGLMRLRIASINDLPIKESERRYHWPLGRRPDDHPSLSDLGF